MSRPSRMLSASSKPSLNLLEGPAYLTDIHTDFVARKMPASCTRCVSASTESCILGFSLTFSNLTPQHTDFRNNRAHVARNRKLIISTICTVANYEVSTTESNIGSRRLRLLRDTVWILLLLRPGWNGRARGQGDWYRQCLRFGGERAQR